jgi:hypothetical protein
MAQQPAFVARITREFRKACFRKSALVALRLLMGNYRGSFLHSGFIFPALLDVSVASATTANRCGSRRSLSQASQRLVLSKQLEALVGALRIESCRNCRSRKFGSDR